jgi:hypothetical protein
MTPAKPLGCTLRHMVEKVVKLGIKREPGYLYFVGDGKLYRAKMVTASEAKRSGKRDPGPEDVVVDLMITQDPAYNYFIDPNGDISRAPKQEWEKQPHSDCADDED